MLYLKLGGMGVVVYVLNLNLSKVRSLLSTVRLEGVVTSIEADGIVLSLFGIFGLKGRGSS